MVGLRFDLWTRRRFGLAASGFAALLLGVAPRPDADAKKGKKKRCMKVGNACRKSNKAKRCCRGLACDVTPGGPGRSCCHRQRRTLCNNEFECCGDQVVCSDRIGDPTFRCCGILNASCGDTADCCGSLFCVDETCQQPPSDRALKANFATVDPTDILQRVRELPITTWNYTSDDPAVRHVGPMAQDFAALFAVGADDRHIHALDGQGVALAAIQGLLAQIDDLQADNARLAARVAALERSEEPVTMPYNEAPASTT
jgi:hypothetical protein